MSISAMKEALEALENTYAYLPRRWGGEREADQAITALRQAIAEAEKQEPMNVDPEKPDHIDHPMRHWDRTCPACVYESDISQERVDELKECVHEFFTKYLNHVEESDSGREFNPVTVGCCRALMLEPLNELLERMRVLSGADRNPLWADGIDLAKVGEVGVWGEEKNT
jgi:hypothetical protein